MNQENLEFSKFRAFFWPIHGYELKKFIPMMALFFFISFNYHLLKIAKDALIITAPKAGAEAIPFLKVWAILPSAIFLTFLFTKLSNKFNRENIFYIMMSIFLGFFIIFLLVLYPLKDVLFLNNTADHLQKVLFKGFGGFISIIRYWVYSLFYIMSEAWSTIILSILLWGFANDVTKVAEAKRFYSLFGIGINAAGIFAGQASANIVSYMQQKGSFSNPVIKFLGGHTSWDQTVIVLVSIIILISFLSMVIYRFLHIKFFQQRASFADCDPNIKEPKNKMSLRKNISYILESKYLLSIAVIVLTFNVAINLTEVLWKTQMRELYPDPSAYMAYMSKVTFFIGLTATLGSYVVSGSYIRLFGWRATALLTPMIIAITGVGFFYFLFLKQYSSSFIFLGMTPLALSVFFGSLQNILTRSAKYTVFDSTKEMAFIPLSEENKLKGKSAIDGIGSRLGKSGSSLIMQILLMIFSTTSACSPIIAVILFLMMPFWVTAINSVNKRFHEISSKEMRS